MEKIKYIEVIKIKGATVENFYKGTTAEWSPAETLGYFPKERNPDYVSDSGSEYWFTKYGVYRRSNHWGYKVATCQWFYDDKITGSELLIGYCPWTDFERTELKIYEGEAKRVFKNGFAILVDGRKVRVYKEAL